MKKLISAFLTVVSVLSLIFAYPASAATAKDKVLKGYTVTASSEDSAHTIGSAFDSDTFTYWHSHYESDGGQITNQDKPPFRITMKMKTESTVAGLKYTPRQDNETAP